MTVLRIGSKIERDFFFVSNDFARDPSISLRAAKVYLYLASHQEGWQVSVRSVAKVLKMSKTTVTAAIQDLVDAGFVDRKQTKDKTGQFSNAEYIVHQRRQLKQPNLDRVPESGTRSEKGENGGSESGTRSDQQEQGVSAGRNRYPHSGTRSDQQEQGVSAGRNRYPHSGTHKKTNSKKTKEEKRSSPSNGFKPSPRLASQAQAARDLIREAQKNHVA